MERLRVRAVAAPVGRHCMQRLRVRAVAAPVGRGVAGVKAEENSRFPSGRPTRKAKAKAKSRFPSGMTTKKAKARAKAKATAKATATATAKEEADSLREGQQEKQRQRQGQRQGQKQEQRQKADSLWEGEDREAGAQCSAGVRGGSEWWSEWMRGGRVSGLGREFCNLVQKVERGKISYFASVWRGCSGGGMAVETAIYGTIPSYRTIFCASLTCSLSHPLGRRGTVAGVALKYDSLCPLLLLDSREQ